MAESSSLLVAFLDADDEWMPEFLEACVGAMDSAPECDAVAGSHFRGDHREDMTATFVGYGMTSGPWRLTENVTDHELKRAAYIMHSSSTVAKKEVLQRYGGFYDRDHCRLGEDYFLWLQVMLNHSIYRILRPLWWYHSEASELACGMQASHVMQPFLSEPDAIRANCPAELAGVLERWFAVTALGMAHECCACGNTTMARELVRRFPLVSECGWEYAKLMMKMRVPQIVPAVRYLRRRPFGSRIMLEKSRLP